MKLALLSASSLLAVFAVAACATSSKVVVQDGANPDGGPTVTGADGGMTTPPESDDPANQPPHSLGTIVLGEQHASGAGTSTGIVSATFYPDALLSRTCSTMLEGSCAITKAPKCTSVSTSTTGCNSNEVCTLDNATCTASCKPFVQCATTCASDEVCQASSTGTGTATGTCVPIQSFDAGPLAFSGTTTEITMFPPYKFTNTAQGAPFLGGAQLHVQASGAASAGFDKFDEMFTATTFLQTSPPLATVPRQLVFGAGALPLSWVPGSDTIIINVTGTGGTATCKVDDSLGTYAVPRSVIQAAQGETTGTTGTGSGSISISISRQKKDVHKDQHAKGTLTGKTIQPDGWLELVTLSTENASFQGCGTGQGFCGTGTSCTDLLYDATNCGKCGNICPSGTCSAGTCTGTGGGTACTTCRQNAESGSCSSYYSTCSANTSCYDLAYCASTCTTSSCVASCESSYSAGYTQWSPLKSCLTTYCSSTCGF